MKRYLTGDAATEWAMSQDAHLEGRTVWSIPMTPQVIYWLLLGEFVRDGSRVRLAGISIDEEAGTVTPTFSEVGR